MSLPIFSRECLPFCPSIFSFYSPRSDGRQIDKFLNHCHFFFWAGEPRKVSPKSRGYPQLSFMLFSVFPWNKPSSYWGTPIYGTPIFYICFTYVFFFLNKKIIHHIPNESIVSYCVFFTPHWCVFPICSYHHFLPRFSQAYGGRGRRRSQQIPFGDKSQPFKVNIGIVYGFGFITLVILMSN